jgi:hypothetical protein
MKSLYHGDAPWEPEDRGPGAGRVLYWLACTIAFVILVFAITDFLVSWAQGHPILHIMGFAAAVVIWVIGRLCRSFSRLG